MVAEDNKALVRKYIEEAWNRYNLDLLDEILSPSYRRYLAPGAPPMDRVAQKNRLIGFREAFPDLHLTIVDLIAEGDQVAMRITFRGTHRGEFQGIPPTGKSIQVNGLGIIRIENGKFAEQWGGPDMLSWLQQLGAVVTA
jgi:steroid delta-isomerase-like uncharacterized protein